MQLAPSLVKHYPLALALAILLLPYIYKLLILPFTFRSYFVHPKSSFGSTGKVLTSSIIQSSSITTSSTTAAGFNLWGGVRQVIGPKRKDKPNKSAKITSSTTTKSKPTSKSISTTTSIKVTTIKDVKTVTKSVTKSITKSVTEPVQITLQNPVEEPRTDGSVVIEEINIMGWHQVFRLKETD